MKTQIFTYRWIFIYLFILVTPVHRWSSSTHLIYIYFIIINYLFIYYRLKHSVCLFRSFVRQCCYKCEMGILILLITIEEGILNMYAHWRSCVRSSLWCNSIYYNLQNPNVLHNGQVNTKNSGWMFIFFLWSTNCSTHTKFYECWNNFEIIKIVTQV